MNIYVFDDIIRCRPANEQELDKLTRQFIEKYPEPTPPKIQVRTFEAVVSGKGYEERDDPDDEEYLKALRKHRSLLYVLKESFFIKTCVYQDTEAERDALIKTLIDQDSRLALFNFIVSISWITMEAVKEAMSKMGYTWYGKPLYELSTPGSPASVSLKEIAYQSASDLYHLPWWEFDKLPVPTKTETVARYLLIKRMGYFQEKHRVAEMEANRKQRGNARGKKHGR